MRTPFEVIVMGTMLKLFRAALVMFAFIGASPHSLAQQVMPLLREVQFGYAPTNPLTERIGPAAVLTPRYVRGVGGVAFVREAAGRDGWTVTGMKYDARAVDGQRLVVTLSKNSAENVTVRPRIWDWELVPLVRFVASQFDAAFSAIVPHSFDESPSESAGRRVAYHPAFKNTLLGLRLMQLDMYLLDPPFAGYMTDVSGRVLLGPGEAELLEDGARVNDPNWLELHRKRNLQRLSRAWHYLRTTGCATSADACQEYGLPFFSYIVGDTISPVSFGVADGRLTFSTKGICWDFARHTEPDEVSSVGLDGTKLLRPLSEAFCEFARKSLSDVNALVARSGNRALTYAALLRHFKSQQPQRFSELLKSLLEVRVPVIATPTEVTERRLRFYD
jgi:hypothetical protein